MTWAVTAGMVGSAVIGGIASNKAANTAAAASREAAGLQAQQYQQTRSDLMPWQQAGTQSLQQLMLGLGLRSGSGSAPTRDQFTTQIAGIPGTQVMGEHGGGSMVGGTPASSQFDQAGYDSALAAYNQSANQPLTANGDVTPGMFTHQFGLQDFQESPAYQFNLQQGQQALDKGANARGNLYAPQTLQDLSKFSQGLAGNEWNNAYSQYQNNIGNIWNRFNSMSQGGQSAANQTGAAGANAANNQGMSLQNAGNAQAAGIMGANTALQGGLNNYMFYDYLKNQQRPAYSAQGPYASGYQFPTQ